MPPGMSGNIQMPRDIQKHNNDMVRVFTKARPDAGEERWFGTVPNYYEEWFCEGCVDSMIDCGTHIVCKGCGKAAPVDSVDEEGRCINCQ